MRRVRGSWVAIAILQVLPAAAQNLVTNPSFESVSVCPDFSIEPFVGYVDDWTIPTNGSSNYFNVCAIDAQWGVPGGAFGSPLAWDGNGYAGLYAYTSASADYREYIEVELTSALVAGATYDVSFRVARGLYTAWAIDRIGAHLSVGSVGPVATINELALTPQVESPLGVPIDSIAWVEISGSFVAAGGEDHIVIGNFNDDAATGVFAAPCTPCSGGGYYYVDGVSVELGCACDGDLDASGTVDAADATALAACLGATPSLPSDTCYEADLSCDGLVDAGDTQILACQLGAAPDPDCCECAERGGLTGPPTPTFSWDHNSGSATLNAPSFPSGATYNAGGAQVLTTGDAGPPGPNPVNPTDSLSTPGIMLDQPALALMPLTAVDVDALSYGQDQALTCDLFGARLQFSVDEIAAGAVSTLVETLGATGVQDASADMLHYLGPLAPTSAGTAIYDAEPGVDGSKMGLREPYQPPNPGDNLDAFDHQTTPADLAGRVYFSMDANGVDPLASYIGGAALEGFSGADVLVSDGASLSLAIPAATLGLDLSGADSDDLDALIFYDRDDSGSYTAGDHLLFSVRRGSAVVGSTDSLLGLAIEPGDVLSVPTSPGVTPSIYIPAERLGLLTNRTHGVTHGDELDALDASFVPEPSGHSLLGGGLALLAVLARRRARAGSRQPGACRRDD
jgi:hypothetical protein